MVSRSTVWWPCCCQLLDSRDSLLRGSGYNTTYSQEIILIRKHNTLGNPTISITQQVAFGPGSSGCFALSKHCYGGNPTISITQQVAFGPGSSVCFALSKHCYVTSDISRKQKFPTRVQINVHAITLDQSQVLEYGCTHASGPIYSFVLLLHREQFEHIHPFQIAKWLGCISSHCHSCWSK